jgi:hypothetical protein
MVDEDDLGLDGGANGAAQKLELDVAGLGGCGEALEGGVGFGVAARAGETVGDCGRASFVGKNPQHDLPKSEKRWKFGNSGVGFFLGLL